MKNVNEQIAHLDELMAKHGKKVFTIWTAPENAIYIGRGSDFGNPFPMKNKSENERLKVCIEFEEYLAKRIAKDANFKQKVKSLHGKTLKCFCSPGKENRTQGGRWCHGHILLEYAEKLNK